MLDKKNLISLAKAVANANHSTPVAYSFNGENYTYEALNDTLRKELNEYSKDYRSYQENKELIFSVMEVVLEDVLPKRLKDIYGDFAEVKTFKQGEKPVFRRKINSRLRAKQFITRVGLAGIYEVFKLGGTESFEVPTSAIGGAVQISLEEFLDGRADFAEVLDIALEGMDDLLSQEIGKAMIDGINQLPTNNKGTSAGFNEALMDHLITVASAYGKPTIYCFEEFAVKMLKPTDYDRYSDAMKQEVWDNGHLASYKGKKVVILPQSFTDETNSRKVNDPGYCWIIPDGGDNKPVKVALEGQTIVDEFKNYDRSREIQMYKKVGVVAMMTNNICVYEDTSLKGQLAVTKPTGN